MKTIKAAPDVLSPFEGYSQKEVALMREITGLEDREIAELLFVATDQAPLKTALHRLNASHAEQIVPGAPSEEQCRGDIQAFFQNRQYNREPDHVPLQVYRDLRASNFLSADEEAALHQVVSGETPQAENVAKLQSAYSRAIDSLNLTVSA